MKRVILYTSVTADGFIARENGAIDWLDSFAGDYGYNSFLDSIDTIVMGHSTYRQLLGFGEFPYQFFDNYVISQGEKPLKDGNKVVFIHPDSIDILGKLRQGEGKDIWLVGGGRTNALFLEKHMIDEIRLFVMPVILGTGIPLFAGNKNEYHLKLISQKTYPDSVVELRYSLCY